MLHLEMSLGNLIRLLLVLLRVRLQTLFATHAHVRSFTTLDVIAVAIDFTLDSCETNDQTM